MSLPQRLHFVTVGAHSVSRMRAFYTGWGWRENEGATDQYASFNVGTATLALYPIAHLRDEAAPREPVPEDGAWNGVTFAINFSSRDDVDRAFAEAVAAGGTAIAHPLDREWGGYSGYLADPEGHRWELAWAPGFTPP